MKFGDFQKVSELRQQYVQATFDISSLSGRSGAIQCFVKGTSTSFPLRASAVIDALEAERRRCVEQLRDLGVIV